MGGVGGVVCVCVWWWGGVGWGGGWGGGGEGRSVMLQESKIGALPGEGGGWHAAAPQCGRGREGCGHAPACQHAWRVTSPQLHGEGGEGRHHGTHGAAGKGQRAELRQEQKAATVWSGGRHGYGTHGGRRPSRRGRALGTGRRKPSGSGQCSREDVDKEQDLSCGGEGEGRASSWGARCFQTFSSKQQTFSCSTL